MVAATLELQVKDPRLGMVTITDARVTPDLREATVFYTVYGDDTDRQTSAIALESAKGVVRSAVGKADGHQVHPDADVRRRRAARTTPAHRGCARAGPARPTPQLARPAGAPSPPATPTRTASRRDEEDEL